MPGAPFSACTTMPESSASAGSLAPSAAARALSSALASKLMPVSSGSGRLSALALTTSTPNGATSSSISRSLPLLCVAITNRRPRSLFKAERLALKAMQLTRAFARQRQQFGEQLLGERRLFRRRLNFDDAARRGQHEIRVGLGSRILGIVEIEHRYADMDPARHRRDLVLERHLRNRAFLDEFL